MMTNGDAALTVKELVLRLDSKVDAYMAAHEARHAADSQMDSMVRGDPQQTAAGRAITKQLSDVASDVNTLNTTVASHERTIQRMVGGMLLLSGLGIGTLILVFLRISGVIA